MTPKTFLKEFGAIANAPGGVQRLREMVLQLAVMGKLVAQDPEDEPASELLKRIEAEKADLIRNKTIKRQKKLQRLTNTEISFEIPKNWEWVRFGTICHHNAGKTLDKKRNKGIPRKYITTSNLYWGRFDLNDVREMLIKDEELNKCQAQKGDLLICEGGEAGRAAVWENEYEICFQNHIHRARFYCGINPYLYFRFFQKLGFSGEINQYRKGVGISSLSGKTLSSIPVPLPPLEEQKRIVAKIDELMALCDRLEAQQQKRAILVRQARISTLDELANAQGGEAIQTTWKRVQDHLSILFDHPDDVEDLKKCILQNAVMGKLVPQNPDDEPASELLKKIAEEKAALIKKGEIKKQKSLPKIREDEKPFKIPKGWVWCRIGDILAIKHGYAFKSKYFKENFGQYILATPGNFFETGGFRKQGNKTKYYEGPIPDGFIFNPNDLMIAMTEQAAGLLGSAAFIPDDNKKYLHNQRLGKLVFSENLISKAYIFWYFNSPYLRQKVSDTSTGMKVKHTSPDKVSNILISFPPLAEQDRIVQKIQSLLSLCIQLQKQLEKSRIIAEKLAQSIVESITGQSTEKQEKMKVPKTELVSILRLVKKPAAKVHAPLSAILVKNNDELSAKALWNTSGLAIDDFYRQLKTEMVNGWIVETEKAHIRITDDQGSAQ